MSRTIAITGASGFTGGAIARHFQQRGWRVLAFGRREYVPFEDSIEYRVWDITAGKLSHKESVDVVVHCAAMVDDAGRYADFHRVNVEGTRNVLDSFRDAGQFIHVSSSSVYDPFAKKLNIREDFPYGQRYYNAYSESKMLAEKVVIAHERSNKIILRPRAIYGEGDTTLLPRLLRLRRAKYLLGIGDGENEISITYIRNFCHAVEAVTEQEFRCEIFNIADAETIRQRDLLARLAHLMNWEFQPLFIPKPIALSIASVSEKLKQMGIKTELSRYAIHNLSDTFTLNIDKARDLLGYQPPYSQEAGFAAVQAEYSNK